MRALNASSDSPGTYASTRAISGRTSILAFTRCTVATPLELGFGRHPQCRVLAGSPGLGLGGHWCTNRAIAGRCCNQHSPGNEDYV